MGAACRAENWLTCRWQSLRLCATRGSRRDTGCAQLPTPSERHDLGCEAHTDANLPLEAAVCFTSPSPTCTVLPV
eukprot:4982789-Amphidinium_carterae.1